MEFKVKVQDRTLSVDEEGVSCDCPANPSPWRVSGHCWHTDALMAFMRTLVEMPR